MVVKIVEEREQQRTAGRNLRQTAKKTPIFFVVVSMGWFVDEFRGGTHRSNGKNNSTIASSQKNGVPLHHPNRTSLPAHAFSGCIDSLAICVSQDFRIGLQFTVVQVSALCFVRMDILGTL